MKETITVTYTATKELAPDRVRIDICVSGDDITKQKACALCAMNCDELKAKLSGAKAKLAAGAPSVTRRYNDGKPVGFRAMQNYSIELGLNAEELSGITDVLDATDVEWRSSYSLKNGEKERDKLKKQAVQNARRDAEVLAEAAEVKLGKLVKIEYVSNDCGSPVMLRAMRAVDTDAPPEPVRLSETVTCGWEIE